MFCENCFITNNLQYIREKIQILPFTTPTLLWVTFLPQLCFGVITEGFTLTLSPTLMLNGSFLDGKSETNKILQTAQMQCVIFCKFFVHLFFFDEYVGLPEPALVTRSISETTPVQFLCSGKSTVNKSPWISAEVKK